MKKTLDLRKLEITVDNLCIQNALLTSYFVSMQSAMQTMFFHGISPKLRNKYLDLLSSFVEEEGNKRLESCSAMLLDEKNTPLVQSGYEMLQEYLKSIQDLKVK